MSFSTILSKINALQNSGDRHDDCHIAVIRGKGELQLLILLFLTTMKVSGNHFKGRNRKMKHPIWIELT